MIISHKHKWIFIHNPKVAGTSVRAALAPYHDDDRQFWHQGWLPTEDRVIDLAHLTTDLWVPIVDQTYTSFGFVRNPYERVISGMAEVARRHGIDFCTDPKKFIMEQMTPANLRYDWRFIHLCPQHYFFFRGNKRTVDHIGKMETLPEDWAAITSLLGLHIKLPHERRGSGKIDKLLDDPEIIMRINSLYLRDFQLFGYKIEGSPSPKSHSERITVIHNPAHFSFFSKEELTAIQFTDGEALALGKKLNISP